MVWVKLRKKYYQHVWILWRVAHFVSITLISSPDQNFSAGIRRVLKTVLYLIVLFNLTFIFFLVLSLIGHMVNFSLDLYVWNRERYEIVHFCIPKFKIKNVKSKWHWKESESDANARFLHDWIETSVVRLQQNTGASNDCFLWNICSEKQKLPRIFYSLRKAKNF